MGGNFYCPKISIKEIFQVMNIDISVIIVNYNANDYLSGCISSILSSSFSGDLEVIVVDNNSLDDSIEKLNPLIDKIKIIKNKDNYGFSKSINIGLSQAKGKYICIANPDIIVEKDCLSSLYQYMEDNSDFSCLSPKILNSDGSLQISCKRSFPTITNSIFKMLGIDKFLPNNKVIADYNLLYLDPNKIHSVDVISGAFMFLRNSLVKKVGLFDERFFLYGEDIDYCRRIYKTGEKIAYFPTAEVIHYKGESAKSVPYRAIYEFHNSMIKYYLKYQNEYKFWKINKIFIIVLINIRKYFSYFFHIIKKVFSQIG